jgi:hypothetical protein
VSHGAGDVLGDVVGQLCAASAEAMARDDWVTAERLALGALRVIGAGVFIDAECGE